MMKNKGNTALPDVRLAKVFNFTSEDLAANRLGFITREQQWNIHFILRPVTRYLFSFLPTRQRGSVSQMCGKLEVNSDGRVSPEFKRSKSLYSLSVSGYTLDININAEQHNALLPYQGKLHRIYYIFQLDDSRIVAMERVENDC